MGTVTVIKDLLSASFPANNISSSVNNLEMKILMHGFKYDAIIVYNFIDEFYTIRIENNIEEQVFFLTQSKKYHSTVKNILKEKKLDSKSFKAHIVAFCEIIKRQASGDDISVYERDLRFDGVWLG